MSMELFAASLLCAATFSILTYLLIARKLAAFSAHESSNADRGTARIDSAFADLVSELQHIANTHVNAVEDRRDELKRVIELANERIRKVTGLMTDMEILERRLREHAASIRDTVVEDEAESITRVVAVEPVASAAREPGSRRPGARDRRRALAEEIESLVAAGHSPASIAAALQMQRNEVEMIIRTGSPGTGLSGQGASGPGAPGRSGRH